MDREGSPGPFTDDCAIDLRLRQSLDRAQVGSLEIGSLEMCPIEERPVEIRAAEVRAFEVRPVEPGVLKVGPGEVRAL